LDGTGFLVPGATEPWTPTSGCRRAGVSAFGFGGANAHMILEEAPESTREPDERPRYLLTLSAKTGAALRELVCRYLTFLRKPSRIHLGDICFTANTGRSVFDCRAAVVTESIEQLRGQLEAFTFTGRAAGLQTGTAARKNSAVTVPVADCALDETANLYVSGHTLDWSSYYRQSPARRVALPTYPFQRQRCRFV
jgi:acyl transferase domain-containing protein